MEITKKKKALPVTTMDAAEVAARSRKLMAAAEADIASGKVVKKKKVTQTAGKKIPATSPAGISSNLTEEKQHQGATVKSVYAPEPLVKKKPVKKKLPVAGETITVTFGRPWVKDADSKAEEGKPQGTHRDSDVKSFATLSQLATALEVFCEPLDPALTVKVAKTRAPYVVWSGLDLAGDKKRRGYNVKPTRLLPFDIDGASPDAMKALLKALQRKSVSHIFYHTASDNFASRRARLVILADRMVTGDKLKEACMKVEQWLMKDVLGAKVAKNIWTLPDCSQVTFDRSMNDPAHFAFLPPVRDGRANVHCFEFEPVNLGALPGLDEVMQSGARTSHHTTDHKTRMNDFAKDVYGNKRAIERVLGSELAHLANTNARSDGTYGWGTICGALGDFIGTAHERWAEDLLVEWSMACGKEWAVENGVNELEWELSIRDEFGKWTNPYKTIFDLAKKAGKVELARYVEELAVSDLDDGDTVSNAPALTTEEGVVHAFLEPYGAQLKAEYNLKTGDIVRAYDDAINLKFVLDQMGAQLCINEMTGQMEMWQGRECVTDFDLILSRISSVGAYSKITSRSVSLHINAVARERSYHPVRDMLRVRKWDGVKRAAKVIDCFNFESKDYGAAIMRKWLIGAYAAVALDSAFDSKLVPIIVGGQSARKSTAISRLAGLAAGQFHDEQVDLRDKDSVIRAVGAHIVEWAEMGNLHKSDVERVKAFISRKSDRYRAPYARCATDKKRQTVFIGTANENGRDLLTDQSGNLRFAPLRVGTIDIDAMNDLLGWEYVNGRLSRPSPELLVQFWLEIKSWFDDGESWHVEGELRAMQLEHNEEFSATESVDVLIMDYMEMNEGCEYKYITGTEVCKALELPVTSAIQVGHAMRRLAARGLVEVKRYPSTRASKYRWPVRGSVRVDESDLD